MATGFSGENDLEPWPTGGEITCQGNTVYGMYDNLKKSYLKIAHTTILGIIRGMCLNLKKAGLTETCIHLVSDCSY